MEAYALFWSDHFCLHILLAFAGTLVFVDLIEVIPGLDAGLGVYLTLPLLIAAMLEGRNRMRVFQDVPSAGQSWLAALGMGALTLLLVIAGTVVDWLFLPHASDNALVYRVATDGLFVAVCAGCAVGLLRVGYAIGVTSEMRSKRVRNE